MKALSVMLGLTVFTVNIIHQVAGLACDSKCAACWVDKSKGVDTKFACFWDVKKNNSNVVTVQRDRTGATVARQNDACKWVFREKETNRTNETAVGKTKSVRISALVDLEKQPQ
jgi:hypothetical protein